MCNIIKLLKDPVHRIWQYLVVTRRIAIPYICILFYQHKKRLNVFFLFFFLMSQLFHHLFITYGANQVGLSP